MNNERNIYDSLQEEIMQSDLPEDEKNRRLSLLLRASGRRLNLMLVGATGCGKSSTINALFNMDLAKVGDIEPETKDIIEYELGNLTIWDTPGLGDSVEADRAHIEKIVRKLSETGNDGNLLIDLVLVVLDASSRDLAVSYDIINNTLIPCLGKDNAHRILIGLNQSDMAMKGRHWDYEQNTPDSVLKDFLTKKTNSIKRRVQEATGVMVEPVCYSAGYTEDDGEQQSPYNLAKLLYYILIAVPSEKRLVIADNLNENEKNWIHDDGEMDYTKSVKEGFFNSLLSGINAGAKMGAVTGGGVLGLPGVIAGGLVGGIIGGLYSLVVKPLKSLNPNKIQEGLGER